MSHIKSALLGRELSHSISDRLHRELFPIISAKYSSNMNGIDYSFVECPTEEDFKQWIAAARPNKYFGVNITYPYKNTAYEVADRRVGAAGTIKSANVIRYSNPIIEATSTDGQGFLNALLREYPQFDLEPYHLVVLGAGAAAKAVVYALCTKWMPLSLTIVNRSIPQAQELAEFCLAESPGPSVKILSINDFASLFDEPRRRLVIQATPVGQSNHSGNIAAGFAFNDSDMAVDLVYRPAKTSFIQSAQSAGAKTLGGLGMLIEQAALSQVFWFTGLSPIISPLSDDEFKAIYSSVAPLVQ
jgi:shikimate dehydrogenase